MYVFIISTPIVGRVQTCSSSCINHAIIRKIEKKTENRNGKPTDAHVHVYVQNVTTTENTATGM